MINRRTLAAAAFAFGASALAMAAPAAAQTKWNLPAAYPADNPHSENLVLFAKDVEAATGGKLAITVHPNASLFKAPEIKRAVASGQAQMGEVLLSIFADAKKLYVASKPAIEKKLDAQGIKLLFMVPWAPQGVYTKKDLNTIEDMKGLKWRSYNVGTARLGELLGMQSVTIQAAELPQALATGVVNSFMSSGGTGYDSKVWESLDHFYDVQAWIPKDATFVNKAAFNALDKATQDAILKAAATAEERGWKMWQEKAGWYIDQLKAKGMKVQAPSPALAAGFKKAGETLTEDWLKKAGAEGKAIVDAYKKM